jgi:two-component system, sensor histidine kinase and response regulator
MSKILVIDDEEWLRDMVEMALEQRGFDVLQAEGGATGIEIARRELPDLVLCDVNMAKIDGYLTLASLRNDPVTATIPFILMTGLADNAGMRHGMELGADDYLPKPFTLEGLYASVETRLKKAQTVRRLAEDKLEALRGNLSLMLPHELKTPLNGIMAYADLLSSDAPSLPPEEIAEMGRAMLDSGRRLERLIENFLIYAQLELWVTDPQHVASLRGKITLSPASVISRCAANQARAAGRPDDLEAELEDQPVAISEEYLAKVVDEVVQNAFKFSNPGQPVAVRFHSVPGNLLFTVTDQGRGFSPDQLVQLGAYMQFDRKLHEQQGLGLGLTISRRLVELHGGALSIQSEPGQRTVVTAKLPAAALTAAKADP